MKGSGNISLFRIGLCITAGLYFKDWALILFLFLFLLSSHRKEAILFLVLCAFLLFVNAKRSDLIPLGIVESSKGSYCIVDKFFYKVIVFDETILPGDILYFETPYQRNETFSQIKKNILFKGSSYQKIATFSLRNIFHQKLQFMDPVSRSAINRLVYNTYSEESVSLELGYGLASYRFFRRLKRKNRILCLLFLLLFSLFFCFPIRYYLLLMDLIFERFTDSKAQKCGLKLILISLMNFDLLRNPSFLLPFLFDLYQIFDTEIGFKTYLVLLSSFLFGETNILNIFFYDLYSFLSIILFLFSVILLAIPSLEAVYLPLIKAFSFLNHFDLSLRGQISLWGLCLFVYLCKKISYKNELVRIGILAFVILLPIHRPFFHISCIDVGQGDAIAFVYPYTHSCILIDTGSPFNYYKLKTFLNKQGIYTIDKLIITHNDSDHNGNVDVLHEDFNVKELVLEGGDIDYHGLKLLYLDAGEFDNDNDNSLIYYLDINGISFLFTGDISSLVEKKLIKEYPQLDIDVLKASHHGSKTGSCEAFISKMLPKIAVLSTSGMYGHPHKEVLEILGRYRCDILSTAQSGDISFYISSLFSFVKTAKNEFVIIRS